MLLGIFLRFSCSKFWLIILVALMFLMVLLMRDFHSCSGVVVMLLVSVFLYIFVRDERMSFGSGYSCWFQPE